MGTTSRYLSTVRNVPAIFKKIQEGVPPDKFNTDHLQAIGFGSSNDRAVVPLLKDLGFLTTDGTPTQRYRDYRDGGRSRAIMAEALRESYSDVFVINENISKADKAAVMGRFKSLHDSSDRVAEQQALTFFSLLDLADMSSERKPTISTQAKQERVEKASDEEDHHNSSRPSRRAPAGLSLTNRFEIQLPATRDVEVFRAIFRAIKEELINE